MRSKVRALLRQSGLWMLRCLGTELVDERTGLSLGRAFCLGWRGKLLIIGLGDNPPVRPFFRPQERLTFWKQELGFASHPPPEFSSEGRDKAAFRPPLSE